MGFGFYVVIARPSKTLRLINCACILVVLPLTLAPHSRHGEYTSVCNRLGLCLQQFYSKAKMLPEAQREMVREDVILPGALAA